MYKMGLNSKVKLVELIKSVPVLLRPTHKSYGMRASLGPLRDTVLKVINSVYF